jgi:hypothetical protein
MRVYEERKPRTFRALRSFGCCPIQITPAGTPIAYPLEYTFSGGPAKNPIYEHWDAWQQGLIAEMQAEGITITHLDGLNTFCGYYDPDRATPRHWILES